MVAAAILRGDDPELVRHLVLTSHPDTFTGYLAVLAQHAPCAIHKDLPCEGAEVMPATAAAHARVVTLSNVSGVDAIPLPTHLSCFVDRMYQSCELRKAKPDPAAFMAVLTAEDIPPERMLHIGDSETEDAYDATAIGARAILIDRQTTAPSLKDPGFPIATPGTALRCHSNASAVEAITATMEMMTHNAAR